MNYPSCGTDILLFVENVLQQVLQQRKLAFIMTWVEIMLICLDLLCLKLSSALTWNN